MELLGTGRDADVYALDAHRVLRRYRDGGDATREAAVMAYVHGLGFPVPAVHDASGPDLVLERLTGGTMSAAVLDGRLDIAEAARIMADLHGRLHALAPRVGAHPDDRVLHLDLHPENVLLTGRGPMLIDWRNTTEGPPDRDVAMTALILAQVTFWEDPPAAAAVARAGLAAFLEACRAVAPGPGPDAHAFALEMRRRNPTMTGRELADLDAAAALVRRAAR